jgi:hypothetical protein
MKSLAHTPRVKWSVPLKLAFGSGTHVLPAGDPC